MELLVVRHAKAQSRKDFARTGKEDFFRPLTAAGVREFKRARKQICKMNPKLQMIATSPLTRATQTAALLAAKYSKLKVIECEVLQPERGPEEFLQWLKSQRQYQRICICGHEPHLSQLMAWLLTGEKKPFMELKKGGAALLELERLQQGWATLKWMMP